MYGEKEFLFHLRAEKKGTKRLINNCQEYSEDSEGKDGVKGVKRMRMSDKIHKKKKR